MTAAPLAVTPGEPAGIGPDLVLLRARETREAPCVVLGDPEQLAGRARLLGLDVAIAEWRPGDPVPVRAGVLPVLACPLPQVPAPGRPEPDNAAALLGALDRAVEGCRDGTFAALVTGPLHKATINDAGIPFTGHTEYLAARAGGTPVMMLCAGDLRVALVTTHLPLRAVPDAVTAERISTTARILAHDLERRFAIPAPRIAVLGLNPHAGEGGHLGTEEREVIAPTVDGLRREGLQVTGPLPADTAFTPAVLAGCDAVLAMYHDQGLPVLKFAGFGHAVNCTLGLGIIRTSVDHGTALDKAGTGQADAGSFSAALQMAAMLAVNQ